MTCPFLSTEIRELPTTFIAWIGDVWPARLITGSNFSLANCAATRGEGRRR